MPNSTEAHLNNKIKDYKEKKLINTDNISDGNYTFGNLYEKIFHLEQALEACREQIKQN